MPKREGKSGKKSGNSGTFAPGPDARRGSGPAKGEGGAPPSELRKRMRGSLADRLKIAESIADGEPVRRIDVPLLTVLQHAHCPTCGDKLKALPTLKPDDLILLTIEGKESASPGDRMKAVDFFAKYGVGTTQEVTGKDGVPLLPEQRVSRLKALLGIG